MPASFVRVFLLSRRVTGGAAADCILQVTSHYQSQLHSWRMQETANRTNDGRSTTGRALAKPEGSARNCDTHRGYCKAGPSARCANRPERMQRWDK